MMPMAAPAIIVPAASVGLALKTGCPQAREVMLLSLFKSITSLCRDAP
jgi:hypothetical protein